MLIRSILPLLLLAAAGTAQKKDEDPKKDPYTQGDPAALERAGYRSLGPFRFADDHTTSQVEHVLGVSVPLLWIETAHFKLGTALPPYSLARVEKKERTKIREELEQLAERLPEVDARTRQLDPWLRAHLFAMRLEALYADVLERLGKADADFPKSPGNLREPGYRGQGPFLGQPEKFTVLLVTKNSTLGHYAQTFMGRTPQPSLRHNFIASGSLFFGLALEALEGQYRADTSLHCFVASQVIQNLLHGYKYYTHDLPLWWSVGLGHWYARRIDERFSFTTEVRQFDLDPDRAWDWEPRILGRVRNEFFPPASRVLSWNDFEKLDFNDNMIAWSRVDYIMTLGNEGFATYMELMKGHIPGADVPATPEQLQARQLEALEKAWGLTPETFDERWAEFVKETYGRKRR